MYITRWLYTLSILTSVCQTCPVNTSQPCLDNSSSNPTTSPTIDITSVEFLGDIHSLTTFVKRDLGFQGRIGPYIVLTYGDTLYTDSNYSNIFRGIVSNSIAFATHDPTAVVDSLLDLNGYPMQFVPTVQEWCEEPSTYAVGITNVIETAPNEGIVFTLLNHRPSTNSNSTTTNNLLGAGIASITLDTSANPPTPNATRLSQTAWSASEPWYGDVCALSHAGYVYAYGHKRDNAYVYVARARLENATHASHYEYYHGPAIGWSAERIPATADEQESVFWQINQGQVFWSSYFNRFLFIYCDNFWSSKVLLKHSLRPEGPWSEAVTVYKATPITENGNVYAAIPHPYFDETGRSLVVSFTNHPNCLQAIRVWFG